MFLSVATGISIFLIRAGGVCFCDLTLNCIMFPFVAWELVLLTFTFVAGVA